MGRKKRKNAVGDDDSLFPLPGQEQQHKRQKNGGPNTHHNSNNNQNRQKKKHNNNYQKRQWNQNRPRRRYWIEDCRETTAGPDAIAAAALTVLITRVELTDDHTYKKKSVEVDSTAIASGTATGRTDEIANNEDDVAVASVALPMPVKETTGIDSASQCNDQISKSAAAARIAEKDDDDAKKMAAVDKTAGKEETEETNINIVSSKTDAIEVTSPAATIAVALPSHDNANSDTKQASKGGPMICVLRDSSAKRKPKKVSNGLDCCSLVYAKLTPVQTTLKHSALFSQFPKQPFRPLPDGDCGDGIKNPYPKHIVADKYWAQRHRLFSRYDQGIQLDKESWYSVTPEAIANHIAAKMVAGSELASPDEKDVKKDLVILDAFCGAGGNAIALARQPNVSLVICVDLDDDKLRLAAQNAKIYEIPDDKLLFIHADAFEVLGQYQNGALVVDPDAASQQEEDKEEDTERVHGYSLGGIGLLPKVLDRIFLSPPWGGVEYETIGPRKFNLKCIRFNDGLDGESMLQQSSRAVARNNASTIACFLPRNTNGYEVGRSALKAGISGTIEVEQNVLNNKFKAITIYLGSTTKECETADSKT